LATLGAIVVPKLKVSALDPSLYIVVPFGHRGGAAPALINGDQCELLLSQAFGRWNDVHLADPLEVHDARAQLGSERMTLDAAKGLARKLGAGMLVWGDVADVGDSTQVTAALYDLRHGGKQLRQSTMRIPKDGNSLEARFQKLADSILLGGGTAADSGLNVAGTQSLGAFYAYAEGTAALKRWDLSAAEQSYRTALELDPDYAQASLWLAYTEMWRGEPTADWRTTTARAVANPQKLGARELALGRALWSLADRDFPDACQRYRRIAVAEPKNFIAWYGLGECQAGDPIVVADGTSPSGWRFRTSYQAAASAYRRALELVPSAHRALTNVAVSRLLELFFAESNEYREGYTAGGNPLRFGAFPSLENDTLAFVPWPIADVMSARGGSRPPTTEAAVERNREELRSSILKWADAFPTNPDPYEALSYILETTGEIDVGPPRGSALGAIRRARSLTTDSSRALLDAVTETRLLFKLEHFAEAARLADSMLSAAPLELEPFAARQLAGLALLTGRAYRAASLLAQSAPLDTPVTWDGEPVPETPVAVKQAGMALLAYAALGGPSDSIRMGKRRVEERVNSWAGAADRERVRLAVLHVPMTLAFETIGLSDVHRREAGGDNVLEMQYNLAHGDTIAVRRELQRQASLRTRSRAGDVAINGTYGETVILLQLHDTAAAIATLDHSLRALPTLGSYLLEQPEQVGCAIRAMALRAELAARAGDRGTAAQWARAVTALWSNADAPLRATTARMRELLQ
jgi:tetratricopeptide (TPR) repeat protein